MMIWSGCFVVLSTLMVLAWSSEEIPFESMPLELQEYWSTKVQSCDRTALVLLRWNCHMFYYGEKSPFTALNMTPPRKTNRLQGRHGKDIIPFLNLQCCRYFCTRWALVRNCMPGDVSSYMPQPDNYKDFDPYGAFPTTTANTTGEASTTSTTTPKIVTLNETTPAPVATAKPTNSNPNVSLLEILSSPRKYNRHRFFSNCCIDFSLRR